MLVAHFIGDHSADTWRARAGWYITRNTQRGAFKGVTHVEAIHAEHGDGTVTIASASLRDGGVRSKRLKLNPAHWLIHDVPSWDVRESVELFMRTEGDKYDLRGALATRIPGREDSNRWFCNEHVGYPFIQQSHTFGPHHLAAITASIGRDVTTEFFIRSLNVTRF